MKNELTYTQAGDYLFPNVGLPEQPDRDLGKYGRMRLRYLKEHRPSVWARLVLTEKLLKHLYEVDTACNEQLEYLVREIAKREGVTEALKAADPMTWVGYMNNIHHRAEEIVLHDLVYTY